MPLTTFIDQSTVRQAINEVMRFPRVEADLSMRVPPRSRRFTLIGTAYDYLLRFLLEHVNGDKVVSGPWVAEEALRTFLLHRNALVINGGRGGAIDLDSSLNNLDAEGHEAFASIQSVLGNAREQHARYLADGHMNAALVSSSVRLAKLDYLCRVGQLPDDFDAVEQDDVLELQQLIDITPISQFRANSACVLNPTFGDASRLVGGADGDLFIDGSLIEIKTSISPTLTKKQQRQLVGYAVLANMGGIDGVGSDAARVLRLGYYEARFGTLLTYPLADVVDVDQLAALAAVFRDHAPGNPLTRRLPRRKA